MINLQCWNDNLKFKMKKQINLISCEAGKWIVVFLSILSMIIAKIDIELTSDYVFYDEKFRK